MPKKDGSLNMKKVKISDLISADYNPRKNNQFMKEALESSIEKFGYVLPIIVNKKTGIVVGWNQRLKVLREQWYTEVDVVEVELSEEDEVELSEEDEVELNIALNNVDYGFDKPQLLNLLKKIMKWDDDDYEKIKRMGMTETAYEKLKTATGQKEIAEFEVAREMFEHHDYIMFQFDNRIDRQNLIDRLKLPRVSEFGESSKSKKVWMWRALSGKILLRMIDALWQEKMKEILWR